MERSFMKKVVFAATLAATVALPGIASAQLSRPQLSSAYIGAGVGQAKAKDGCTGAGGAGISCDDKDTAYRLFGGYQFNRNVAAELGYADLGKVKASGGGVNADIKASAWDLSAIGSFPVANQFSLFGRLGLFVSEAKLGGTASGKKTTNGLTFGLGAQYDVNRNIGVRAEWQRYNDIKARNNTGAEGKSDYDVLGVSLLYRFQ
jgi:OmpA-OmpF porin, OOP family